MSCASDRASDGPFARFEDHVGELELTLEARSLEEVFAEAARVVSRECGATGGEAGPWERVSVAARDAGTLLVDWLNEMIGRSEVEGRAYGDVRELRLSRGPNDAFASEAVLHDLEGPELVLTAEVRGAPVREWESALKAATYHGLELERERGRWRARVLLDV